MNYPPEIKRILEDRESGSVTLLNHLLQALLKQLFEPESNRDHLRALVRGVRRKLVHFAAIENLCKDILQMLDPPNPFPGTLLRYLESYRLYWKESGSGIADNFLRNFSPEGKTMLTHSQSHTILSLLAECRKRGISFKILQTLSVPGEEGKISYEKLKRLEIEVMLIDDEFLFETDVQADCVLMGCDALLEKEFLNKKGTSDILSFARKSGIHAFLISESRKEIHIRDWKNRLAIHPLFEWTSMDLITAIVTEKSS